jgi:chemosensory pili system protein ChpA (sensor histidine kinase/response regulator)
VSVAAAPLRIADAGEHDIDAIDHLDTDLFPIFQEEAFELMPALGTALRQWVARPDNLGARSEALRVLHTLKGSARLAGAMRLGEMSHRMESGIEVLGSEGLQSVQLEPLLARLDSLQATLDALDLAPRQDISQPPKTETTAAPAAAPPQPADAGVAVAAPVVEHVSVERVTRAAPRSVAGQTVRVRALLLDRLVNQAGEVMISRSRLDARVTQMRSGLGELSGNLERLRQQLRDVEVQAESQMQSRMAHTKDDGQTFDPLEFDRFTRVQELTRMMAESVNDVATVQRNLQRTLEGAEDDLVAQGRQARELQRDLLRTRMVEFESISERLYGVVRQAAKECAKQVKLAIVGGSIEMDRGVLDRMTPAFEHILRNAVAHGIEEAEVRVAAGKPPVGSITITVHQESNDVSVSFGDDGGGLHLDKIRAKAIASKLIAADDVLSDEAAARLLFAPGFSTASEVTELSGRGIGMDVVLSELNALGGKVDTQTTAGEGTTFRLVLPLTTAVTQVVMLRVGDLNIGVPSNLMETVLRAPLESVQQAYVRGVYDMAGQDIPFFWGGALLQVSGRSQEVPTRNLPVAVLRSAGQRLALHVDEVLGNREVVVKNLGPQLARLPGLAGMSVLASGAVVLIYNPVALATVYGDAAKALTMAAEVAQVTGAVPAPQASTANTLAPLVLVVDDSITVRRVTQRLLKREGFRVALANDGLHALEVLAQEKPDVVLSDIEMPRMDGFDLVRNIRNDANLRDLPVIMITSRIAEKHREHAMELGVDHYLGKPYAEDELLALIRTYCAEAEVVAD